MSHLGGGDRRMLAELGEQCHRRRYQEARQLASYLLASCDMRTLYLRNVPDDVVERLQRLAARDATSVGAVAVRELAEVSRRADNAALLGELPDLGVDVTAILNDVDAGRADDDRG
jgi:plasmid stability protein